MPNRRSFLLAAAGATGLLASPRILARGNSLALSQLRQRAHQLSSMGLGYQFGSNSPDKGGMDCSGTMQHLFSSCGYQGFPRTSAQQYDWLKEKKTLRKLSGKKAAEKLLKHIQPGDLVFWGGTWDSGHRVSHVMFYLGYDPREEVHYSFGARSKSLQGRFGNGVDIFPLNLKSKNLVGHGSVPGVRVDA